MVLHERDVIRDKMADCVFADRDLTRPVPKYTFPQEGTLPRDAFQLVADELMLDGNARQNLATFCQTWEAVTVMATPLPDPGLAIRTLLHSSGFGRRPGVDGFCALNKRGYRCYNSQRHADGVDVTPFTSSKPMHNGDPANNSASRSDPFPVNIHLLSRGSQPSRGSPICCAIC